MILLGNETTKSNPLIFEPSFRGRGHFRHFAILVGGLGILLQNGDLRQVLGGFVSGQVVVVSVKSSRLLPLNLLFLQIAPRRMFPLS